MAIAGLEQVVACIESARECRYFDLDRARSDAQRGMDLLHGLQTSEERHEDLEADLLVLLGGFDRQDGQLESAVIRCHAALRLIGSRQASMVACDAWTSLGWSYAFIGEFAHALRYSLHGLKIAREIGARDRESHALDVIGCVYAIFGDSVEAMRHLEEAAGIAREIGDRRRLCSVLNNLAMTLLGREELASALSAARESLRIARENSLTVSEPNVVDTVASVLVAMGDLPAAETCLLPAVSAARKRPPNKALANLLNNLGTIRAASGDPAQAESLHIAALGIASQIGDPMLEMKCHNQLAALFAGSGRWQEAYQQFRRYHELNESVAGAKAAKRLTCARIAVEVNVLQDAIDPMASRADDSSTVGALEALTERLRAGNRELAEAKRAADAANETKSRFLANISHELRTPLNGVLGMAHVLLGTPLNENQARYCRAILTSGQALNELVTAILDYTKIEAGRCVTETVEFEIERVVHEVLDSFRPAASTRGLHVVGEVDARVPRILLGDAKRVRQVLQRVVGNAVKFTHEGAVDVRVTPLGPRESDPRVWIRFAVRDTGIGIRPDAAAELFKPFVQADSSPTRQYGGSGLGLAISRQLVELMGGTIDFRSESGNGSEFWFEIPFGLQSS